MSTQAKKKNSPDPFETDGLQLVFVDPTKDVFTAQAVIGPAPAEFYQKKLLEELVEKALKSVKPDLEEKQGYEMIKYEIVIKKLKSA